MKNIFLMWFVNIFNSLKTELEMQVNYNNFDFVKYHKSGIFALKIDVI